MIAFARHSDRSFLIAKQTGAVEIYEPREKSSESPFDLSFTRFLAGREHLNTPLLERLIRPKSMSWTMSVVRLHRLNTL